MSKSISRVASAGSWPARGREARRGGFFAAALGLAIAAGVFGAPAAAWAKPEQGTDAKVKEAGVGLIELEETPLERPSAMSVLFKNAGGTTLRGLIEKVRGVEKDPSIDALVIRLRGAGLGVTQVEELGQAIGRLRASGKKVYLFSEYYSTPELLLGSYTDDVIIQDGGPVSFPGLYMQEMYLADTLAWAGVKADMIQVGDYKGANETMVNAAPSKAWDENISGLLDSMYAHVRDRMKEGRKLNDQQLDEAMRQAWMASETTAKNVGLVDTIVDLPGLGEHLEGKLGAPLAWTNILKIDEEDRGLNVSSPMALFAQLAHPAERETIRDTIAVVHVDGPIVDGESTSGGFSGENQVGSWTLRRTLGEIEEDDNVKGVIVRINSPGGSAIASEIIWQGVRRVAAKKPVWVSVGSMAASGGYYILSAGDKVYVNPSSIVGSIGVVGGKMALAGLYDKLKLHVVSRARGPEGGTAGLLASPEPWTEEQRALVRSKMKETYDLFTKRVSQGRPGIDLSKTAEGRLFTGERAVQLKMADKVGGLETAIDDLAEHLNLTGGDYDVFDYPAPKGLGDVIGEMLGSMAQAPDVRSGAAAALQGGPGSSPARDMWLSVVREVVGEEAWPSVRDQIGALMQLRKEPVILASPHAVIVK
jgi:protease-4